MFKKVIVFLIGIILLLVVAYFFGGDDFIIFIKFMVPVIATTLICVCGVFMAVGLLSVGMAVASAFFVELGIGWRFILVVFIVYLLIR